MCSDPVTPQTAQAIREKLNEEVGGHLGAALKLCAAQVNSYTAKRRKIAIDSVYDFGLKEVLRSNLPAMSQLFREDVTPVLLQANRARDRRTSFLAGRDAGSGREFPFHAFSYYMFKKIIV